MRKYISEVTFVDSSENHVRAQIDPLNHDHVTLTFDGGKFSDNQLNLDSKDAAVFGAEIKTLAATSKRQRQF